MSNLQERASTPVQVAASKSGLKLVVNGALLILVFLLSFALGFLGIETTFWFQEKEGHETAWHDPNTQFDRELGWSPIPDRRVDSDWGPISSNSLGFRSAELDPEKEHIVVLGDSVVWGYGVGDQDTFSAALNRELRGTTLQVSNLGVSGYGTGQQYLLLKRHIQKFKKLKLVILVVYTLNDLSDTGSNTMYGKSKPLYTIEKGELKLTNSPVRKYSLRNIFSISTLIRKLSAGRPKMRKMLSTIAGDVRLGTEETQRVTAKLMEQMARLAEQHGARFLVILSPSKLDFPFRSTNLQWFQNLVRSHRYDSIDLHVHLKNQVLGHLYLPGDPHHYSSRGHHFISKVLLRWMEEQGAMPSAS